ncbi:dTMP kinase [bacterium]|nr:dTMP kinase [bacterium]
MNKGKFITFEGTDGCGKTTQCKMVLEYLKAKGIDYVCTREPGGTKFGEQVRGLVLSKENHIDPYAELLLMVAGRVQHICEVIKPALDKGVWVVCDRFSDATVAYQGYGGKVDVDVIYKILDLSGCGIAPDLTFFIDIDAQTALARTKGEKDRFESKGIEFLNAVRSGYQKIAKANPKRVKVLDGALSIDEIAKQICEYVDEES